MRDVGFPALSFGSGHHYMGIHRQLPAGLLKLGRTIGERRWLYSILGIERDYGFIANCYSDFRIPQVQPFANLTGDVRLELALI